MTSFKAVLAAVLLALAPLAARAAVTAAEPDSVAPVAEWRASVIGGGSTGTFAPYLIGSLNHGKTPYKGTALVDGAVVRGLDLSRRFAWGFGAEALAGYQTAPSYDRWEAADQAWTSRKVSPPAVWLQQCYAEVKWRGVFLTVGLKEYEPRLLNYELSSGDLVASGNARPIPQARAGFVDFQDIPFTNGWVQIQGEVGYGRMPDNAYMRSHYNYYNYHLAQSQWYVYKCAYFRSNPRQPFSVTVGMQAGSYFGGRSLYYVNGELSKVRHFSSSAGTFLKMLLPFGENGEEYYLGGTLGSWDFHARYRLGNGAELQAYFHWLWEDGTGIGRANGWDGLWGLEYKAAEPGIVDGVVAEYLDFRNQSGPIHWDPDDHPETDITNRATGEDNYYNQGYYNSWANYGMAMGSPYFKAPIYNLDGYPAFTCNRMNGFHIGVTGHPAPYTRYRLLAAYSRGLGRYAAPFLHPRSNFSMLLEASYDASRLITPGLGASVQLGFDKGALRGDSFGAMLTVSYSGIIPKK